MRIAVAGATGNIGALTAAALERGGHEVVRISRSLGIDLSTGEGLDAALAGVDAVVDATNAPATDRDGAVAYFGTTTRNLLAAEERAGVRHHVLLSIVGIHRVEGNPHYAGKREQERLVASDPTSRLARNSSRSRYSSLPSGTPFSRASKDRAITTSRGS